MMNDEFKTIEVHMHWAQGARHRAKGLNEKA
jgi:hypothetical protein